MIIAFLGSKGGTGKTMSALTLLSAVADHNATQSEAKVVDVSKLIKTAAVDTDKQRSLIKFSENRDAVERPALGITFSDFTDVEDPIEALEALDEGNDLVVVDIPGHYSDAHLKVALAADRIIIPTNLETVEIQEMITVSNHLEELIEMGHFSGDYATLLAKIPNSAVGVTKFNRAIITKIRSSGYPVLSATLSHRPPIPDIMNHSKYLFEQVAEDKKSKSKKTAYEESKALLQAVLQWTLLPELDVSEDESEGQRAEEKV